MLPQGIISPAAFSRTALAGRLVLASVPTSQIGPTFCMESQYN